MPLFHWNHYPANILWAVFHNQIFYSCLANNIIFTCLRELSLFTWRGGGVCGVWAKFFWNCLRRGPNWTIIFPVLDSGHAKSEAMKLDTGDHPPICRQPNRVPLFQSRLVDKIVNERLAINICKPSRSTLASPAVIVSKKNTDEPRFGVDYRGLNVVLCNNCLWSLQMTTMTNCQWHIDDLLANLGQVIVIL